MTVEEADKLISELAAKLDDSDRLFAVMFSGEQNRFHLLDTGIDADKGILIIDRLIDQFDLEPRPLGEI